MNLEPPQTDNLNNSSNISEAPAPVLLFNLGTFHWERRTLHEARVKADVERRHIVRPAEDTWGIFYDPEEKQAVHFPPPVDWRPGQSQHPVHPPSAVATQLALFTLADSDSTSELVPGLGTPQDHLLAPPIPVGSTIPVRTVTNARRPQTSREEIEALFETNLKLPQVQGLHYVLASHSTAPATSDADHLKLLLDTGGFSFLLHASQPANYYILGCPVTWMYSMDTKKIDVLPSQDGSGSIETVTDDKVKRGAGARSFQITTDHRRISPNWESVAYADGFVAHLDCYQGPFALMNASNPGPQLIPDLKFGTCFAATTEMTTEEMDGIFGMGKGPMSIGGSFVDLFHRKISWQHYQSSISRFTVALHARPEKSFLIVGNNNRENDKDPTRDVIAIPRGRWSPWLPVLLDSNNNYHWTLRLYYIRVHGKTIHFRDETGEVPLPVIIDTGSVYTYLPPLFYDPLFAAMKGEFIADPGHDRVPKDPTGTTLRGSPVAFGFYGGEVVLPDLEALCTTEGGATAAYYRPAIKPGVMQLKERTALLGDVDTTHNNYGIIGNLFLRSFLVEFKHAGLNSGTQDKDSVRFALRE
ncbi:hypothetical protein MKEN_00134700 [Mycena kentingensis (nom. inval.)]|nr:hypothetical protein MKEN_00134700 [Mycena kentingensis (nom. inval.)]